MNGTVCIGTLEDRTRLAEQFQAQHHVILRELMDIRLLGKIRGLVHTTPFRDLVHSGIGSNLEQCMESGVADHMLHVIANGSALFHFVEAVTGCRRISRFDGRVYRMAPGAGHHDAWHNDCGGGRLIGMSLNLSESDYQGGLLELKERDMEAPLAVVHNTGPGDALLFRIDQALVHRVTEVIGANAKTAFAGWFCTGPTYVGRLRDSSV